MCVRWARLSLGDLRAAIIEWSQAGPPRNEYGSSRLPLVAWIFSVKSVAALRAKPQLRRYKRRWIVERTNAWLGQFRRLLVRHEHLLSTYRAFFYLACFWITLRHCL